MSVISLLENISSEQVEDLIFQQELESKGYTFYYVLDNHDIRKYCFPGNLDGEEFEKHVDGGINFDLETDILTAYEEFFKNISPESPVFLFLEYVPEFVTLRKKIIEAADKAMLFNYVDDFMQYLDQFKEEDIPEDFTLFIAIATGLLKDGVNRFNGLVSNDSFVVDNEVPENIKHAGIFDTLQSLDPSFSPELANTIFDSFLKRAKETRRFSKRTDSEVIAKVIEMNNHLLEKLKQKKMLLLYLSSTKSSPEVFMDIRPHLPMVEGVPFNFHRTVDQLFLNRLFQDLSPDERIGRLREAARLVANREETGSAVIIDYQQQRERYININFARKKQFEEVEELFTELSKLKEKGQFRKIKALFNKLKILSKERGDQQINLQDIKNLESSIEIKQLFTLIFKKAFLNLTRGKDIQLRRGTDPIMGVGQHLPIVFISKASPQDTQLDDLGRLFIQQSFMDNNLPNNNDLVKTKLNQLRANSINNDFYADTYLEKLLYALYLLILPDTNSRNGHMNSQYVEEFLMNAYKEEEATPDPQIQADLLYAIAWVLRRNSKYDEALKVTKEGMAKFPDDARFLHSRFLITACLMDNKEDDESRRATYAAILKDIRRATEMYPSLLDGKDALIGNNIYSALLNSEAFTTILELTVTDMTNEQRLAGFRRIRTEMVGKLKENLQEKYLDYPEFLHTEAFLEFQEFREITDIKTRAQKINGAIRHMDDAIRIAERLLSFKTDSYTRFQQELVSEKEALQKELMGS